MLLTSRKCYYHDKIETLAIAQINSTSSPRAYYVPTDGGPITGWHSSTFYPIPELRREDADTHVIVVQNNGLRYYASNDDPLFAAHKEKHILFDDNSNRTMYTADQPASFLGCTEQVYI
jgi:hypothetical protein